MAEVSLEFMQDMTQRIMDGFATMHDDMQDVKTRLSAVERAVIGLRRDQTHDAANAAHAQDRMDRLGERVARIERRLEIVS